jgi:GTP pyrophosphokinase
VIAVNSLSDKEQHTAAMHLTVEVVDLYQLSRVLARIHQVPNVTEARRYTP